MKDRCVTEKLSLIHRARHSFLPGSHSDLEYDLNLTQEEEWMTMMIHPVPEKDPQSSASQEALPSAPSPFLLANSVGIMAGSGFFLNGSFQRPGGPTYREHHTC